MFEELKEKLKNRLIANLPGEKAHLMMMPTARDNRLVMPSFKTSPIPSAVLILLYSDENGQIKFPLIQRPTYNGAHSGQIGLPGGKAEPGDTDLVDTALRETHEEIGVDPDTVNVIGRLSDLHISVSNFVVAPVVAYVKQRPDFILDPKEVVSLITADLYDIVNPDMRKEGIITIRDKYKIETPYFEIENQVVWGATAMILSELSMLIRDSGVYF